MARPPRVLERGLECDLRFAHGSIYLHVAHTRANRRAHEKHIAAQTAPFHLALDLASRIGVRVRKHHALQRHGHDEQTEDIRGAGPKMSGQSSSPPGTESLHALFHPRTRPHTSSDTPPTAPCGPPGPFRGARERFVVPRGRKRSPMRSLFQLGRGWTRLEIFLHVIGNARPASRNFEVAPPILRGHLLIGNARRLPAPQPIDADFLACRCGFAKGVC
jgi:hypothetical protein